MRDIVAAASSLYPIDLTALLLAASAQPDRTFGLYLNPTLPLGPVERRKFVARAALPLPAYEHCSDGNWRQHHLPLEHCSGGQLPLLFSNVCAAIRGDLDGGAPQIREFFDRSKGALLPTSPEWTRFLGGVFQHIFKCTSHGTIKIRDFAPLRNGNWRFALRRAFIRKLELIARSVTPGEYRFTAGGAIRIADVDGASIDLDRIALAAGSMHLLGERTTDSRCAALVGDGDRSDVLDDIDAASFSRRQWRVPRHVAHLS